jgi:hypothetical protein
MSEQKRTNEERMSEIIFIYYIEMIRVPTRRGSGAGVVVKTVPAVMPQRVVNGSVATIRVRPMPDTAIQSQPKYQ